MQAKAVKAQLEKHLEDVVFVEGTVTVIGSNGDHSLRVTYPTPADRFFARLMGSFQGIPVDELVREPLFEEKLGPDSVGAD